MLLPIPATVSNASHPTSIQLRTFRAVPKSGAKPSKRSAPSTGTGSTAAPKRRAKVKTAKSAKSAKPATAS